MVLAGVFEGATGKLSLSWNATTSTYIYSFEITLWPHRKRASYAAMQAATIGLPMLE